MKLYHVSQEQNNDYDTYSDFVICAVNEEIARNANPDSGEPMTQQEWEYKYSSWCNDPKHVKVTYLGEASKDIKAGIICASYHAG